MIPSSSSSSAWVKTSFSVKGVMLQFSTDWSSCSPRISLLISCDLQVLTAGDGLEDILGDGGRWIMRDKLTDYAVLNIGRYS